MPRLVIHTFTSVPDGPRGFVRDLRLRWACEEAGLDYEMQGLPFPPKSTAHFEIQPFGQVPWLVDGDITIFESGAALLYLADKSEALLPADPKAAAATLQWTISALNSIEMVSVPWWYLGVQGVEDNGLTGWLDARLSHLEQVLARREWLAGDRFTVADLLMADVLRVGKVRAHGDRPATEAYVRRMTGRPAFLKAHADQMAHFAKAD